MKNDIKKLPKWAQKLIEDLETETKRIHRELVSTGKAHAVLHNRNWFTLSFSGQYKDTWGQQMNLYILNKNSAQQVASIGEDDVVLIGRHHDISIDTELKK